MVDAYRGFFTASTGASAAFIGLLFVSISFIDSQQVDEAIRVWRRIIAESSFSQLVNIFFVSIASLLPGPRNIALVGIVMAVLGLIVSFRLLPRVVKGARPGRHLPSLLGLVTVGAYVLQLVTAAGLAHNPDNKNLWDFFVLAILILYAGALARAWEIAGIKRH